MTKRWHSSLPTLSPYPHPPSLSLDLSILDVSKHARWAKYSRFSLPVQQSFETGKLALDLGMAS